MIFITYGQPKSASTHLFLLVKQACEALGDPQKTLLEKASVEDLSQAKSYWSGDLSTLANFTDNLTENDYLALKTHEPFSQSLRPYFNNRKIVAFISYRHVGDAALSAFDAGVKARRAQNYSQDFYKLETHRAAIDYIGKHVKNNTIPWLKSGVGFAFSYDEISSKPNKILKRFSNTVGVDITILEKDEEIRKLISGEKKAYNYNKGIAGRHAKAFSQEDIDYMEEHFGTFNRFCAGEIGIEDL